MILQVGVEYRNLWFRNHREDTPPIQKSLSWSWPIFHRPWHGPHHVEAQFQKGHRRRDEDLAEHGQGVRASLTPTKKTPMWCTTKKSWILKWIDPWSVFFPNTDQIYCGIPDAPGLDKPKIVYNVQSRVRYGTPKKRINWWIFKKYCSRILGNTIYTIFMIQFFWWFPWKVPPFMDGLSWKNTLKMDDNWGYPHWNRPTTVVRSSMLSHQDVHGRAWDGKLHYHIMGI